jgi:hypothetical protein
VLAARPALDAQHHVLLAVAAAHPQAPALQAARALDRRHDGPRQIQHVGVAAHVDAVQQPHVGHRHEAVARARGGVGDRLEVLLAPEQPWQQPQRRAHRPGLLEILGQPPHRLSGGEVPVGHHQAVGQGGEHRLHGLLAVRAPVGVHGDRRVVVTDERDRAPGPPQHGRRAVVEDGDHAVLEDEADPVLAHDEVGLRLGRRRQAAALVAAPLERHVLPLVPVDHPARRARRALGPDNDRLGREGPHRRGGVLPRDRPHARQRPLGRPRLGLLQQLVDGGGARIGLRLGLGDRALGHLAVMVELLLRGPVGGEILDRAQQHVQHAAGVLVEAVGLQVGRAGGGRQRRGARAHAVGQALLGAQPVAQPRLGDREGRDQRHRPRRRAAHHDAARAVGDVARVLQLGDGSRLGPRPPRAVGQLEAHALRRRGRPRQHRVAAREPARRPGIDLRGADPLQRQLPPQGQPEALRAEAEIRQAGVQSGLTALGLRAQHALLRLQPRRGQRAQGAGDAGQEALELLRRARAGEVRRGGAHPAVEAEPPVVDVVQGEVLDEVGDPVPGQRLVGVPHPEHQRHGQVAAPGRGLGRPEGGDPVDLAAHDPAHAATVPGPPPPGAAPASLAGRRGRSGRPAR